MKSLRLKSFRLKNFKAVRDSGEIRFTPLTVFIGNNGSGKSSVIEGLKTFYDLVGQDVEDAMLDWHGYESIWYRGVDRTVVTPKEKGVRRERYSDPTSFALKGRYEHGWYSAQMEIGLTPESNELFISNEKLTVGRNLKFARDSRGNVQFRGKAPSGLGSLKVLGDVPMGDGVSLIGDQPYLDPIVSDWQFLYLDPKGMGEPSHQYRTSGSVDLNQDGSNLAEYLMDIKRLDPAAFEGLIKTLKFVLPYVDDLEPELVITALDRQIYLRMKESKFDVPGWLLSTGSLRFVGLLALLRHPNPPSLMVIEELENGLDPRTLNLVIDEIRNALETGKTQVIATTHSPYLLDLLDLSQIILVERTGSDQPSFIRPSDQQHLKDWAEKFSPGQLYTMDLLHQKNHK